MNDHNNDLIERTPPELAAPSSRVFLVAAVLVGALLRIAWAHGHMLIIGEEGAEYARIAQNLLAGRGYVGIFNDGAALPFPPLHPFMIAAVSSLLENTEKSAQAINILFGAALVIPTYRLAEDLYGRGAARLVAALIVLHPVLLAGGASTIAEGPHLTLLMSGLLWLTRWARDRRVRVGLAAGVFLGLAYLIRPEALPILALSIVGVLVAGLRRRGRAWTWGGGIALVSAFAIVVAPYVAFLTRTTGQFRIQTMGTLAYEWVTRSDSGMSYSEAAAAIGADLSDQGVDMRPSTEVVTSASYTLGEYLGMVWRAVRRELPFVDRMIIDGQALGSPWLFALVVIGLFRTGWSRHRLILEAVLLVAMLVLLIGQALWFRSFYAMLGILFLWGGKGADELGEWGQSFVHALGGGVGISNLAGRVIGWGSIGLVVILSLRALSDGPHFADSPNWERARAGKWLAQQQPRPKRIMDTGAQVTYYAGADLVLLPFSNSDVALQYIANRQPDFLVLLGRAQTTRPYATQWFDEGVPDPRAVLVYDAGRPPDEIVKIYRWSAGPPTPRLPAEHLQPKGPKSLTR